MGSLNRFSCKSCGYAAMVAGGRDQGMMVVVRTMICDDCQDLVDATIGHFGKDGATGDPELDGGLNRCPECGGTNVQPWSGSQPCPRCGGRMEKDLDAPEICWD